MLLPKNSVSFKGLHYSYLLNMDKLPSKNPEVYKLFQEGYYVIRRSDIYLARRSTDMIKEQLLMRSLKHLVALQRGGCMTKAQKTIWLLSTYLTSKQH